MAKKLKIKWVYNPVSRIYFGYVNGIGMYNIKYFTFKKTITHRNGKYYQTCVYKNLETHAVESRIGWTKTLPEAKGAAMLHFKNNLKRNEYIYKDNLTRNKHGKN